MTASSTRSRWSSDEVHSFLTRNGLSSPLELPRLDKEPMAALDWPPGDREDQVEAVHTYRRLHNLTHSVELSERLQDGGIFSAAQVAAVPPAQFAAEQGPALGLDEEEAATVHRRAVRVQNRVLQMLATVNGVAQPHFRHSRVNNVSPELAEHFEELPSYQEMFGSLDYCACEQCRSIFGPAAYLVDLLRIVDKYVTKANKATLSPNLILRKRRPDIEQIPLTCEMTNDPVPYLRIVDERLLETAATLLDCEPKEVLVRMATTAVYPSMLPVNIPLEQVRSLLGRLRLSLGAVYAAWGVDRGAVAQEQLGLSPERAEILRLPATEPEQVAQFYGIDAAGISALAELENFLAATGLTVEGVEALVVQGLSATEIGDGVAQALFVNQGAGSQLLALRTEENGATWIENLTVGALDRLNRLRRLADSCGWQPAEADWALRGDKPAPGPLIDDAALEGVETIRAFAARFELAPVQAAAMLGPIKTFGADGGAGASLFDQLFNPPSLTAGTGVYQPRGNPLNPGYTTPPLEWTGASSSSAALGRVLPGLGLGLDAATALATALFGEAKTPLDVEALSALYRHALLARCLNLPVDQYLTLLELLGLLDATHPGGAAPFSVTDLELILSRSDWMAAAGLNPPLLAYATAGAESAFVDPLLDPELVEDWLREVASAIPADAPDAEALLDARIATFLGTPADLTTPARQMAVAAVPPVAGLTWVEAFLALPAEPEPEMEPPPPPPHLAYAKEVLGRAARWLAFATAAEIPAEALTCARANPVAFGLAAGFDPVGLDALRNIADLSAFIARYQDRRGKFVEFVELSTTLASADAAAALAAVTGWDQAQIETLLGGVLSRVAPVLECLRRLAACFAQTRVLGADVEFVHSLAALAGLPAINSAYATEAEQLLAKLSASLGPAAWATAGEKVEGELAAGERDPLLAVVEVALRRKYEDLDTPEDVWEYLLTDVSTGPEAQISYVKEALNAVQLYLQRCRLRIEPGVETLEIPESWWDWILDYRRWEANRRIFVYPENYLLPSVRGDRTKLFRDLEDTLQQSELSSSYVEDAYSEYLQKLLSLSELAPVDSFAGTVRDERRGGAAEAFYLFGRSAAQPPRFHVCRQLEGGPWSEWEEIGLAIPATTVTPAYAFDRLFLFWVQLKDLQAPSIKMEDGTVATTYSRSSRATIQYAFQDPRGRWSEPQVLDQDVLVDFAGSGQDAVALAEKPLFAGAYDTNGETWQRVLAFGLSDANLAPGLAWEAAPERLVVIHGGCLNPVTETVSPQHGAAPTNPDGTAFQEFLAAKATDHDRQTRAGFSGNQLAGRAYVLNPWLEGDVLVAGEETLFLDAYWSKAPIEQYRVGVNDLAGAVQLIPSADPLGDQHDSEARGVADATVKAEPIGPGQFTSAAISPALASEIVQAFKAAGVLDQQGSVQRTALANMSLYEALEAPLAKGALNPLQLTSILDVLLRNSGAPSLFSSVDPHRGRAVPVKGLPGSVLLDNGDESLLLAPAVTGGAPPFSSLQKGLTVNPPPLHPGSFTMPKSTAGPEITYARSKRIFELFGEFSYLDADGFVDLPMMREHGKTLLEYLKSLGYVTAEQAEMVARIVLGYPVALPDAFVTASIDPALSQKIYTTLQEFSLVDGNGRVNLELLNARWVTLCLAPYVSKGELDYKQTRGIFRRLAEAPTAITVQYRNDGTPGSVVEEGCFSVTRLTTAAVPRLQRALAARGIDGLLDLHTQGIPVVPVAPFERLGPEPTRIDFPEAIDAAQVDFEGLYGRYFWELFFHGPILMATSLAAANRHREAIGWFQKVFDPTAEERFVTADLIVAETGGRIARKLAEEVIDQLQSHAIGSPPAPILSKAGTVNPQFTATSDLSFLATKPDLQALEIAMTRNVLLNERVASAESRFWRFRPFRNHTLETLKEMLTDTEAIRRYDDEPFDPFAIAALRIGAFEKATVMQYVDTLLQWGDRCFAEDTWESVTAASMLYLYASDLLGPRPRQVGIYPEQAPKTFAQIREHYEQEDAEIPQFLLYLESSLPLIPDHGPAPTAVQEHGFNDLGTYFGVPENPVLASYWDRVEDRLYKIEHSLDISGRARSLALFEPPLDPLALARAAAGSGDTSPPAGAKAKLPPVRFAAALQRARALTATTSALGTQTLAAVERGDGEQLALLQATQQAQILALTTEVQQDQIDAAEATLTSLRTTLAAAEERVAFYSGLLATGLIDPERTNLDAMAEALLSNIIAGILNTAASIAYAVPQAGSPFAMTYGGVQLGSIVLAAAGAEQIRAEISNYHAQRSLTMAGYQRREEEWGQQLTLAQSDVEGIGAQIEAAEAQASVARRQLAINAREIAQSQELERLLRSKFSNEQLYRWMAGRLSTLHHQTYLLALEAASEAQSAFQFEFHRKDTFLDTDVWDGARKGLLAGEALGLALDRMEAAAQESLHRPLEIERVVSLGQLDPLALDALKTTGSCEFELPELLFDYDYPGHYARQIKSISLSIPAIVGPYENVKATLTQTFNALALESSKAAVEWLVGQHGAEPADVRTEWGSRQQIAVSRGVEDSGQFVLDFNDPRYLPFEGTGAVSRWTLEMTPQANRFDFGRLSDVIVTVHYTARDAPDLAPKVRELLQGHPLEVGYYVDARQGHPIEWEAMLRDHSDPTAQTLRFEFEPQWSGALRSLTLEEAAVRLDAGIEWPVQAASIGSLTIGAESPRPLAVAGGFAALTGLGFSREDFSGTWEVAFDLDAIKANPELQPLLKDGWLDPDVLTDLEVIDVCKAQVY